MLLSRAAERYDEDSVRVRPGRGSRPRTRRRPRHEDAARGFVVAVDRGRYTCLVDGRRVTAMKARELGRRSIVVGDRVSLVGDVSGSRDALARIVRVGQRTSTLRRTADDDDPVERVIVANVDQLVIVSALAEPEPRPRLIDRCLVAARDAGVEPLLCLTKSDLAGAGVVVERLREAYEPLGIPYVITGAGEGVDRLRGRLADRASVLVGHSGVGKSTLVNALVPAAGRSTGDVNAATGRGRHVSVSAVALPLSDEHSEDRGGWIVDTPGFRGFGLAHVASGDVVDAFPELAAGTEHCPSGCSHLGSSCALDDWVSAGHADAARLDSLRRLLSARQPA